MSEEPSSVPPATPYLSVESGNPTDEEVAALVVVFAAATAGTRRNGGRGRRPGEEVSTAWSQPSRRMRPVVRRGPRAWRRNALPH